MNHAIFYTKITGATVIALFFAQKKKLYFCRKWYFFMEHMKIFMQTDDENVDWEQECFLLFTLDGFATGCEPFPLNSALSQLINTCGAGQH